MSTNLIVNGDFESNPLNNTGWGYATSIEGWTATRGFIEIQEGAFNGNAEGDAVVELDARDNSTIEQTFTVTDAGTYTLSLEHALRTRRADSNGFEILIDGTVIDTIQRTDLDRHIFVPYAIDIALSAGEHTLAFAAIGTSDGSGSLLNKVSLVAAGDPPPPPPPAENQAPTLDAAIADQSATQGDAFSFALPASTFSDPDADALTVTATLEDGAALPAWLSFNGTSFSGTPEAGDVTTLQILVTATDPEGLSASDLFEIDVAAAPPPPPPPAENQAPTLDAAIADQSATQGDAFAFALPASTFSDPDADALTVTATLEDGAALPAWLSFNGTSFSGTPEAGDVATLQILVTATDPEGLSASDLFEIDVAAAPPPPPPPTGTNLIVNGDFESNPLNNTGWGYATSIEGWTATRGFIEIQEGAFNGNAEGDAVVELDARDNSTIEQTFTVTDAGTYTLSLEHALRTRRADSNGFEILIDGTVIDTIQRTDLDRHIFVPYAIDIALSAGEHTLAFAAIGTSDGSGSLLNKVSLVAAGDPPPPPPPAENQAPTLDAAIADQSATQGDAFSFALPASTFSDPDADALTVTATLEDGAALPAWLSFNGTSFSGTPEAGDVTTLQILVTATDPEGLSASDLFEIDVAAAPPPPPPPAENQAPTLDAAIADQSATQGDAFAFALPASTFSDPDADALTVTATLEDGAALPAWLSFNGTSFSGTPEAGDVATLQILVTATDPEGLSASDLFEIDVAAAPPPPPPPTGTNLIVNGDFESNPLNNTGWGYATSIEGWTATRGFIEIQEGAFNGNAEGDAVVELDARDNSTIEQTFTVTDAGTYTLSLEHALRTRRADSNGFEILIDGTVIDTIQRTDLDRHIFVPYAIDIALSAGEHTLAFAAIGTSDGSGSLLNKVSLVAAGDPPPPPPPAENQAPTLDAAIADQSATQGDAFSFALPASTFSDPDADALTVTATLEDGAALPAWLSFNGTSFSGTPEAGDVTTLQILVTATDPEGLSASDLFEIDVAAAPPPPPPPAENQAPTLDAAIADQSATQGDAFAFALPASTFSDPDADALTVTATLEDGAALPAWLSFNGTSFSGTPEAGDVATLQILVTATDPEGLSASDLFEIDVAAAPPPPPPPTGTNLIVNGDFESNPLNNTGWGYAFDIEGWTATRGFIEVRESGFNEKVEGDAIVELDARDNSTIAQTFTVTNPGTYTLSVDYSMRGRNPDTNGFEILLDGVVIETIQPTEPGFFSSYSTGLGLTEGEYTLSFAAIGTSDGAGTYIDNVAVTATDIAIALQSDSFRFDTSGTDTANVLANDTGIGLSVASIEGTVAGTPVAVTSTGGRAATVTLAADGTLSVAYSSDFDDLAATANDTITFGYTAQEFDGDTGNATVTIEINGASELLSFAGTTDPVIVDLITGSQATAAQVLQLGDSITRGFGSDGGYRSRLWDDLVRDGGLWYDAVGNETTQPGVAPHDIDHQGINGITTAAVANRIDGIVNDNPHDVALILLGSNDAFRTTNSPDTVPGDLMTILQSIYSANADVQIFLGTILPRRNAREQTDIDAINAQLPQLVADAQALGMDITLVDTSSITLADMFDGVHPTDEGYQKLADIWEAALQAHPDFTGLSFNTTTTAVGAPDRIVGSEAGDRFIGDANATIFEGAGGSDWISPGAGNDILRGGPDADVFLFSAADDRNVIEDFETGDILIFDGAPETASLTQSGADVTITYGASTVIVENTQVSAIDYWVNDSFFS